jgi:enoyl-CoA hydratase/carnithine racemase
METYVSPCEQVQVKLVARVLRLRLCRPNYKNALTLEMYTALADALDHAGRNPEVRALLLEGSEGCFTSGNDLLDFMNNPEISEQHPVVRFMRALQQCGKPVVASVCGPAVGIGTTLLLHCDLVYAAEDARFQLPFVNLGLCPEFGASYLLPRLLGQVRASELLLLGEVFDGRRAEQLGLVNAAMPEVDLYDYVEDKLSHLAAKPPAAVARTRKLLRQRQEALLEASIAAEFIGFAEGLGSEECKEAITAFFEKRAPNFSHF